LADARRSWSTDIGANDESRSNGGRLASLSRVLGHCRHVKALVAECAEDLASVNGAVTLALTAHAAHPGLASALGQSAALAAKVEAVSVELSVVNRALQDEIRDRSMVDLQFAAAQEQGVSSRHAALHDVLTGLPNRALFNDRLDHGLAQAQRHGWSLAVMFVDLDDFKIINDTHGHDAGDAVLQAIAQRLKETTRGEDTVSRHGGDEFLYLLTGIRDAANIAKIAQKIVQAVQAPCDIKLRDSTVNACVTASVGISTFPKDGATAEELINSADKAMFRAKQAGSGVAFA
jgi:diguanylate cyclase (GGDEF)-like protein